MESSSIIRGLKNPIRATAFLTNKVNLYYINNYRATNIYEREWDVAIILDACSYELIDSIDADLPGELDSIHSVAGMTGDWMRKTFKQNGSDTIYITAAPFSRSKINSRHFYELDEVWKYAFDNKIGTVRPRPVTDRAVYHRRQHPNKKMIVHYMQPHFPAISDPELGGKIEPHKGGWPDSIWTKLSNGEISKDSVWEAYTNNLRRVLDELELLMNNIDSDNMIITSDHGNAFGGLGFYGHGSNLSINSVRKVPWIEAGMTTDKGIHDPANYERKEKQNAREKLKALGYHEGKI